MRRMRRLALCVAVVCSALVVAAALLRGPSYALSASLVVRAAQVGGFLQEAARAHAQPVEVSAIRSLPTRYGPVRSRLYRPVGEVRRAVLVLPGVHAVGIDEPRMRHLARELAATGFAVVTMELPDLMAYRFTAASVDQIEDGIRWLSGERALASDGRVGVMGVSFAGGLALAAAGRPEVQGRVAYVFSFGGYGDLARTLRYLCTGVEPLRPGDPPGTTARHRRPHDYGVAVILVSLADRFVPPEQVGPLRQGITTFLKASQTDMIDKPAAARLFAEARQHAATLPEPAATLLRLVNERNVDALGPRLLPVLDRIDFPATLSPESSPAPDAPVFLLHGTDDNVIPAVETLLLADHLHDRTRVRTLFTALITHAEVQDSPSAGDVVDLVAFWADVLRQ
jgi:acetyl esterase/lipase